MKKRILAIFLCLILTLSLAAAVAAEDFTVTLPPGSNFLPPNRPEQPEPDDEDRIVTLQIPIIKIVELGGKTRPRAQGPSGALLQVRWNTRKTP